MNRGDQLYRIRPVNTCLFADRSKLSPIVSSVGRGGNWPETTRSSFRPRLVGGRTRLASLLLLSTVGSAAVGNAVGREGMS